VSYDTELDSRIQKIVSGMGAARKNMFGSVCYLINGNMMCGVYKDFLILRLGAQLGESALKESNVRPFDITGRPMKGWVMVSENGFQGPNLRKWINKSYGFVLTLESK
jgi:hypothetical protein